MLITGSYHRCNVCGDNSELNTVFGLEMERYNTLVNLLWYWHHQCQLRRIFEDYKEDNMGFWLQVPKSCLPGWQASHSHPREAPAQLAYSEHAASIWKKRKSSQVVLAFVRIFDIPAPWQNASPSFPRTFLVVMVCPPGAPSRSAHHQPRQVGLREAVVDHCASFLHRSCHLGPDLSNTEASGVHVAL